MLSSKSYVQIQYWGKKAGQNKPFKNTDFANIWNAVQTKMKAWSIINNEANKLKLFQMQSRI